VDINGQEVTNPTRCQDFLKCPDSDMGVSRYDLKLKQDHQTYLEDPEYHPDQEELDTSSSEGDPLTDDELDAEVESSSEESVDSDIYDDDHEFDERIVDEL
jgi:hypothetical protein